MEQSNLLHKLNSSPKFGKIVAGVIIASLLAGLSTGYFLSSSEKSSSESKTDSSGPVKAAQQDTRTFRDFAQGKIAKKPEPTKAEEYTEGTHILVRDGAVPVTLTSSVVDLSLYEGKKVKVFGETQKAIKEGWLMDVGRVEEIE